VRRKAVDDYPTDACAGGGGYTMKDVWLYVLNMTDRHTHTDNKRHCYHVSRY
jgi:hypothetical protein